MENNSKKNIFADSPISDMGLSVRAYNGLTRAGVKIVSDIYNLTEKQINDMRIMNEKSWVNVVTVLYDQGFPVPRLLKQYFTNSNKTETNNIPNTVFDDLFSAKNEDLNTEYSDKSIVEITTTVKELQKSLCEVVLGQDNAINTFAEGYFKALLSIKVDKKRTKPLATYLFAGSPGVGKTFLSEQIAKKLNLPYMRFDMSEYCDKEANLEFIGTDKAYKNGKCGNVTGFVEKNPKCVILFDEIEKAHINVIHLFLQMLDSGFLRDNYTDTEVPFKDAIIIFTTNAGKQLYENSEENLSVIPRSVVIDALSKDINPVTKTPYFPAAICSRFASGNVVMFNSIKTPELYKIAKKEILRSADNIESGVGIKTIIDESVYAALLFAEGTKLDARTIKSRAENFILTELYELLRFASEKSNCNIKSLHIKSELPCGQAEIDSLFYNNGKLNVLLFSNESIAKKCEKHLSFCNIISTESIADAKNILKNNNVSLVLIDPSFEEIKNFLYLDREDFDSTQRDFRKYLQDSSFDVPTYLILDTGFKLSKEEKISFTSKGIKGFFEISENKIAAFVDDIKTLCNEIHIQNSINYLSRNNKCIKFETKQSFAGGNCEIVLYDFKFEVSVNAEDKDLIVSDLTRPNESFDDVFGANDAKEELSYFVDYLKNPNKYKKYGVKSPKGVLLYGPAGTGKTMLAKAMAGESGVTFIATEGNKFVNRYVGEGKNAVHRLFSIARKYAPTIIFIDEIDVIAKERNGLGNVDESVLTAFFTEMDGFANNSKKPVFVLAATNYNVNPGTTKSLDSAFVRRFDRSIFVDLPSKRDRIDYINNKIKHNKIFNLTDNIIENIAVRSTGMSFSSLEAVFETSLRLALRKNLEIVTDDLLEEAFEITCHGEEKQWDKEQLLRVARHECGHALLYFINGNTPSYLTIVARGNHGGYMQQGDIESKVNYTKQEMLFDIQTSLAGRAAEIVYYGESDGVSTGAASDLKRATEIARSIICDYGMDSEIGLAYISKEEPLPEKINKRTNEILLSELENAVKTIEENKHLLDNLVDELMKKDRLTGKEIVDILSK